LSRLDLGENKIKIIEDRAFEHLINLEETNALFTWDVAPTKFGSIILVMKRNIFNRDLRLGILICSHGKVLAQKERFFKTDEAQKRNGKF
jgi:hypothetical protein